LCSFHSDALEIKLEPRTPEMAVVDAQSVKSEKRSKSDFARLDVPTDPNDLDLTNIRRSKSGRFNCPLCSMTFKAKKNLVRHHKIVHQEERFYCRSCDGVYTTLEYLQAHEIEKHGEGLKAYECDFCKKKFRLLRMLRGHMKNHLAKNKMLADLAEGKVKAAPLPRSAVERTEHMCHICGTAFKGKARYGYSLTDQHRRALILCFFIYLSLQSSVPH
jgi:C2H2-type zinc finger/Zinc finger, C2H2 type